VKRIAHLRACNAIIYILDSGLQKRSCGCKSDRVVVKVTAYSLPPLSSCFLLPAYFYRDTSWPSAASLLLSVRSLLSPLLAFLPRSVLVTNA